MTQQDDRRVGQLVRESWRRTRRRYSAEERSRIVLEGQRGEQGIAELRRREGISRNDNYRADFGSSANPG